MNNCSYKYSMHYEWSETKYQSNLVKHGVDFVDAQHFEWEQAHIAQDLRRDYGEARFIAYGFCLGHFMVLAFTPRGGNIRVISYRKANSRERSRYAPI